MDRSRTLAFVMVVVSLQLAASLPNPKPETIHLSSAERAEVLRMEELDNPWIQYQQQQFINNPQWFIQPGRPCNNEISPEEIYFRQLSPNESLPHKNILQDRAKDYCLGLSTPGDAFPGVFCNPEIGSGTCECDTTQGTWDKVQKKCAVLPGGFCFDYGDTKAECQEDATCIDTLCSCNNPDHCASKVNIPDPGRSGDPRP